MRNFDLLSAHPKEQAENPQRGEGRHRRLGDQDRKTCKVSGGSKARRWYGTTSQARQGHNRRSLQCRGVISGTCRGVPSPNNDGTSATRGGFWNVSNAERKQAIGTQAARLDQSSGSIENFNRSQCLRHRLTIHAENVGLGGRPGRREIVVQVHVSHLGKGAQPSGHAHQGCKSPLHCGVG